MRMSDVVSRDTLQFKRLKFYKGEENLRHSGLVEKAFGVKLRYRGRPLCLLVPFLVIAIVLRICSIVIFWVPPIYSYYAGPTHNCY